MKILMLLAMLFLPLSYLGNGYLLLGNSYLNRIEIKFLLLHSFKIKIFYAYSSLNVNNKSFAIYI